VGGRQLNVVTEANDEGQTVGLDATTSDPQLEDREFATVEQLTAEGEEPRVAECGSGLNCVHQCYVVVAETHVQETCSIVVRLRENGFEREHSKVSLE
jgi:hypothetical protein